MAALRSEMGRALLSDKESWSGSNEDPSQSTQDLFSTDAGFAPKAAFQSAVNEVLATAGLTSTERAARIMELQEGGAAGPVNHVLLKVDNPGGGEDRIRVDLRGASVGARIDMTNTGEADRVASKLGDLQRTLERHGLETESLRVRNSATTHTAADLPRAGLALAEAETSRGSAGSRSGSGGSESYRDAWKESGQGQTRRDPSDPRNRFRRPTPEKENA
jgi:hypothetical protein